MNAKEMFEALGYRQVEDNEIITYINGHVHYIYIDTKHREYWHCNDTFIDLRLHEAITQQIKELGWL